MNENIHKMILDRDVEIDKLKDRLLATNVENGRLRETLKFCAETLKRYHPEMNPEEPCIFYEMWAKIQETLNQTEGGA